MNKRKLTMLCIQSYPTICTRYFLPSLHSSTHFFNYHPMQFQQKHHPILPCSSNHFIIFTFHINQDYLLYLPCVCHSSHSQTLSSAFLTSVYRQDGSNISIGPVFSLCWALVFVQLVALPSNSSDKLNTYWMDGYVVSFRKSCLEECLARALLPNK